MGVTDAPPRCLKVVEMIASPMLASDGADRASPQCAAQADLDFAETGKRVWGCRIRFMAWMPQKPSTC